MTKSLSNWRPGEPSMGILRGRRVFALMKTHKEDQTGIYCILQHITVINHYCELVKSVDFAETKMFYKLTQII